MRLVNYIIFGFFISGCSIVFADMNNKNSDDPLMLYVKYSGGAADKCKSFSKGTEYVHATCNTECYGKRSWRSWKGFACYFKKQTLHTKITLSLARLAMKKECAIINSDGSLKAIKTVGKKAVSCEKA